jgi:hypothetical protein
MPSYQKKFYIDFKSPSELMLYVPNVQTLNKKKLTFDFDRQVKCLSKKTLLQKSSKILFIQYKLSKTNIE